MNPLNVKEPLQELEYKMGYGTDQTFAGMRSDFGDKALYAASARKPGSKTETEGPGKTLGGGLSSAAGLGLVGMKVGSMIGTSMAASAAAAGGTAAATTGATAGAAAGPWGLAIGAAVGLAAYYLS
jgi:hypothetical protein